MEEVDIEELDDLEGLVEISMVVDTAHVEISSLLDKIFQVGGIESVKVKTHDDDDLEHFEDIANGRAKFIERKQS